MRVKVSKTGIIVAEAYNWVQFGMLIFNRHEMDAMILHIRYRSGAQHSKFPTKLQMSELLYNCITALIDTQEINYELIRQLNDDDKDLFNRIITASKLGKQLKYNILKSNINIDFLKNRYMVLQGQVEAGNTSAIIKSELADVVNKLVTFNVIPLSDSLEMIKELKDF
jgi:hypothetical protein